MGCAHLSMIVAAAACGLSVGAPAEMSKPTASAPVEQGGLVVSAVRSIRDAPDPSAVVLAYANVLATDRGNARLHDAYVSRMVELGLPELAYHQARLLAELDPNNGMAWAVLAHASAKRGEMGESLSAVIRAVDHCPENPFVQRTAGAILAWCDENRDPINEHELLKKSIEKMRKDLAQAKAFSEAYAQGKAVVEEARGSSAPVTTQSARLLPVNRQDTSYRVAPFCGYTPMGHAGPAAYSRPPSAEFRTQFPAPLDWWKPAEGAYGSAQRPNAYGNYPFAPGGGVYNRSWFGRSQGGVVIPERDYRGVIPPNSGVVVPQQ